MPWTQKLKSADKIFSAGDYIVIKYVFAAQEIYTVMKPQQVETIETYVNARAAIKRAKEKARAAKREEK